MKALNPLAVSDAVLAQLKVGAFLTVKAGESLNTMTIGWGMIGVLWQKPVFMAPVRNSRHTFSLLERAKDFTVSVPSSDQQKALTFCGTTSGRDVDKFKECRLRTLSGVQTASPVIEMPGIHLECKILYKAPVGPDFQNSALHAFYPEKDYHTLYYGEIVSCYELND